MADDVELTVDLDVCEANAVCVGIAPELFELDNEDALRVLIPKPATDQLDRAQLAVESCPKRALTLRPSNDPN